ncbi:MAG: ribonuclease E/G [Afipia sp.]|nr:ribonuclease E/G [Afipia sp.]
MSERRSYLDRGIGEIRGVVTLDGRPERLIIRRDTDDARVMEGARLVARVDQVEAAIGAAFVDLGGIQALLPFKPDERPVRGAALIVEIRSEPRAGKLAVARRLDGGDGAPRLLEPAPSVEDQLQAHVRGIATVTGPVARTMADEAEEEALETVHAMPGGGTLAIEPTRALTAVDVDLGERKGGDSKRAARQANMTALAEAARLLRLKGLGGLVVMDLVGRGHDGAALLAAARQAFGADNPGVSIGPVGRFGTMELSIPRRSTPVLERLRGVQGELAALTIAHRLIRRIESEAAAQPGQRLVARCAPGIAEAAALLGRQLSERIGARFTIQAEAGRARDHFDVGASA